MKRFLALLLTMAFLCIGSVALADEPEPFDLIEMSKTSPFKISDDLLKVPGLDNGTLEAINPVEENDSLWYDPDNAEMVLAPSKC